MGLRSAACAWATPSVARSGETRDSLMMFAFLTCIRRPHVTYASNSPVEEESSTVVLQEGVDVRVGRCRRKTAIYLCTPAEAGEMNKSSSRRLARALGTLAGGETALHKRGIAVPGVWRLGPLCFVSLPFFLVCASAEDRTHAFSHYPGGLADL